MKKIFNRVNLYTLVALLYFTPLSYLPGGSVMSFVSHALFILLSVYYVYKVLVEFQLNPYLKALTVLFVLIVLYGSLLWIIGPDGTWIRETSGREFLRAHLQSILPIYVFYYFSKKQLIDERWFQIIIPFFFILAGYSYYINSMESLLKRDVEETQNNAGYLFLALLPSLSFYKNKPVLQYTGLAITFLMVMSGMKRGAIVIEMVAVALFIWNGLKESQSGSKKKYIILLLTIGVLIFGVRYVSYLLESSSFFVVRMERTLEGDYSGREFLYPEYFNFFLSQSNVLKILFGNGAYATCKYLGLMAHCDWLEIAINMGLFGLIIYGMYWVRYYQMLRYSRFNSSAEIYMAVLLFGIIYLTKSLFSMSIMGMSIYATTVLGYCIARIEDDNLIL